jgi:hypothetical protein
MLRTHDLVLLFGLMLAPAASADVQVSIGIGLPNVNIGINVPAYPRLVVVPGYPVYYAPGMHANFFFYDGMYWVYQDNYWYSSSWYNGPWWVIGPEVVPVYVLRVPVRYYSLPPPYFRGWRADAPPRWGDHWGRDWEQRRSGWDRWDRREAPAPAPRPDYQREYSGDRYPKQVEQQYEVHQKNYRYEPREAVVREHYKQQEAKRSPDRRDEGPGPRSQQPQQDNRDHKRSMPDSQQGRQEPPDRKQSREQDPGPQDAQREPRPQGQQERQERPEQRQSEPRQPQSRHPENIEGQRPQPQQQQKGGYEAPPPPQQRGHDREQGKGPVNERESRHQDTQSWPGAEQQDNAKPRSQPPPRKHKDDKESGRNLPNQERSEQSMATR